MTFPMKPPADSSSLPVVALAEIPALMGLLVERIRRAAFAPDLVVYVESGARLPAASLCGALGVAAIPVRAQRRGRGFKRLLAPLIRVLPRSVTNGLRRLEERIGLHARTGRKVELRERCDLRNRNILLLDDAVDTGRTLAAVKAELVHRGADPARLRSAVLAATTPAGRMQVDFYVLDRNSVLPWSSDSAERREAERLMKETILPRP